MHPSAVSLSKSVLLASQLWAFLIILEPLKQMRADLNKAKNTLAMIQEIVLEYSSPFFRGISSARRQWYSMHSWPIPTVGVNTRGGKVPCSMSRTQLEYWRFYSFSSTRCICCSFKSLHDSAFGLHTLIPNFHITASSSPLPLPLLKVPRWFGLYFTYEKYYFFLLKLCKCKSKKKCFFR